MSKIRGYRFECEVCKNRASIQVFYRKDGQVGYARARHYGADKRFYYHQQSLEYTNSKLRELGKIDPCQASNDISIDQSNAELGSKSVIVAGGEGFEPSTPNLGGWCSIRTELLAHNISYKKKFQAYKPFYRILKEKDENMQRLKL